MGSKKVVATRLGYYDHRRIRPGETFEIPDDMPLGSWMVEAHSPLAEAAKAEAASRPVLVERGRRAKRDGGE